MKRRIFNALTAMALGTIVFLTVITTCIYYSFYSAQTENGVKALTGFFVGAMGDYTKLSEQVTKNYPYPIRVTVVDSAGTVVFDNAKKDITDNHLSRPEISSAFDTGVGEATRTSDTLGKKAYYYAEKYTDDTVVRLSVEIDSLSSIFISILPFIIFSAFIVVVAATIIAGALSRSIIRPVTALAKSIDVLDGGQAVPEAPYDELREVSNTVRHLTQKLEKYISQLKKERSTINLITDNMVEGMILLDENDGILSVNKSAAKILNKDFVMSKGGAKHILQLTRNTELLSAIEQAQKNGAATTIIHENEGRHYRVFVNRAGGESGGCIALLVDVTDAVHVEEIRRDFAANVSHELKTPLTTIKGFGELLSAGGVTDSADVTRYGGIIFREGERLLFLINDIMRLSEIEDGVREIAAVNLLSCAASAKAILEEKASQKQVAVTVSGDSVAVPGNESYLRELFLNLCDNAIKYNVSGGTVTMSVTDGEKSAVIIVQDSGIGIPREHQERIFERFYRVDKSRSKQTGGTGLGLSIVKHIVLYHKGSIRLESDNGTVGTKIIITLPK